MVWGKIRDEASRFESNVRGGASELESGVRSGLSEAGDFLGSRPELIFGGPTAWTDRAFRGIGGNRLTNQGYMAAGAAAGGFILAGTAGAGIGLGMAGQAGMDYNAMRAQQDAQDRAASEQQRANRMQRAQAQMQMQTRRRQALAQMRMGQAQNMAAAQATGTQDGSAFMGAQGALRASTAGSIATAQGQQRTQQATLNANQSAQAHLLRGQRRADRYNTISSLMQTGTSFGAQALL